MALGWLWWHAWAGLFDAAALCVAGVGLGDIHRHLAWQAWHLATSTFVSRGRRGILFGTGLALVARLGGLGRRWRRGTLRGRRGTWWHPRFSCVAGVALGDIHLRFTWQAWHLWHWASSGDALGGLGRRWRRGTLRGRRGTWRHPPSFHVAGVVSHDITHYLSHTIVSHAQLVTQNLSHNHTTLSHTIFSAMHVLSFLHANYQYSSHNQQLCHRPPLAQCMKACSLRADYDRVVLFWSLWLNYI